MEVVSQTIVYIGFVNPYTQREYFERIHRRIILHSLLTKYKKTIKEATDDENE